MSKYSKKFNSEMGDPLLTDGEDADATTPTTAIDDPTMAPSSSPATGSAAGRHRLEHRGAGGGQSTTGHGNHENNDDASTADSPLGNRGKTNNKSTNNSDAAIDAGDSPAAADAAPAEPTLDSSNPDKADDEDDEDDDESDIDAAAESESETVDIGRGHGKYDNNTNDNRNSDDGDDSITTTSSGGGGGGPKRLFSCDVCPHLVFYSHASLDHHAVEAHGADLFPDYLALKQVSAKLVPLWDQVQQRKAAVTAEWGRKVFTIARQRDAGPAKMEEAHRAREQLEHVVRRWHPAARVFVFGSSVAFGVWDGISDIDFTVVDVAGMEAGTWPPPEKNAVRSITELLRRAGFSYVNLEPIPYARVPIIKHHASSPIRIASHHNSNDSMNGSGKREGLTAAEREAASRLEAEDVISRSVRFVLTAPATPQDRLVLEGSVRDAIGADGVQQVWWNRTAEMMCVTCDSTNSAIAAATCGLSFVTPGLRARVQPLHDECRPELYNLDFDLSFRSFGVRNSELLNRYLAAHPCARPGAIVLKDWSKTSGVNNSMNGYLTSYAINIMWIYFLVQKGVVPYVDPLLDVPASLVGRTDFGPTYIPMVSTEWNAERLEALYAEAGELLLGFFYFYSHEFDWANNVVSLNRKGTTTKRMAGWDREENSLSASSSSNNGTNTTPGVGARKGSSVRYTFCIEDPYEENLNLGRHMGVTKALRVYTELHRGLLSLLKDGHNESCVFAATDRAAANAAKSSSSSNDNSSAEAAIARGCGGGDIGDVAATSAVPPASVAAGARLPLTVLYKLMGIAIREVATAKQRALSGSNSNNNNTNISGGLLRQEQLQAAFTAQAPQEYQLACKAWNWQQLVHRLGYKLHRGCVVPRREIGVRRLARTAQPPPGVVPSSVASSSSSSWSLPLSESSNTITSSTTSTTMGLSEQMAAALAQGFLRLTPEWVAWSKPWATVHLRGMTFFTPPQPPLNSNDSQATTHQNSTATGTAISRGGSSAFKGTQPRAMRWSMPPVAAAAPAISTAAMMGKTPPLLLGATTTALPNPRRLLRALFRK